MGIESDWITENVALIRGLNDARFPHSHSFLIRGEKCALIDTGCGAGPLKALREKNHVDFVINSHTHPDHVSGNWIFNGYDLWSPIQTKDAAGRLDKLAKRFVGEKNAVKWKKFVVGSMGFRDYTPTNFFDDNHVFDLEPIKLRAVHIPGHVKDHFCFFIDEEKILFSSDIDLTDFGPWYGHEESDIPLFIASIKKVRDLKPRMILSSHRSAVKENIDEEFEKYLGIFEEREKRILDFLRGEKSLEDFVKRSLIYGGYPYPKEISRYWEGEMVLKHLKILEEKGEVERIKRNGKIFFKRGKR